MKFLVVGTGGVGGYFGAKLHAAGHEVWFAARGEHLGAMKARGLSVVGTDGRWNVPSVRIVASPAEAGPVDVILFCVKSYDTRSAAEQLQTSLHHYTLVLSLQNGIDNEEILERILPTAKVFAGAAYVSSRITAPGVVTETGGLQRIVFGPRPPHTVEDGRPLLQAFLDASIKAELRGNIEKELWKKFIFIATMGGLTALSRLDHGEILNSPETRALLFDGMNEVERIARAMNIETEPLDFDKVVAGLEQFDPRTRSSMYYDLVNGKPLEIEALSGTVVKLGRTLNIATPIHRVFFGCLFPYHQKHLRQRSQHSA